MFYGFHDFLLLDLRIRHTFMLVDENVKQNGSLSSSKVQANLEMFQVMIIITSVQLGIRILLSWLSPLKLVRLMNDWTALRERLERLSGDFKAARPDAPRQTFIWYHVAVILGTAYVIIGTLFPLFFVAVSTSPHADRLLEVTFLSTLMSYFVVSEALHDVKVVLMLRELAMNFCQV